MDNRILGMALRRIVSASQGVAARLSIVSGWRGRDRRNPRASFGDGKIVIAHNSSLRKRMRADRRGITSVFKPVKIKNPDKFLNSSARKISA